MKHRSRLVQLAALAAGFACTAGVAVASGNDDTYVSYGGTAVAQRDNQFLYHEQDVLHYRDGKIARRVVLYTCRDGSPFARKEVSYVDTFSPDFMLEDASNGMREGIRSAGNARQVFFRADRSAPEKSSVLPPVRGLVADAGFDEFVLAHWNDLVSSHSFGLDFLVPSRLEAINFKVEHVRSDEIDGVPVEVFRLKLSGILGWVAPSIDVYYSAKDHTLVRYVGLSDLRDRSNENFNARIDFRPADRKPGDEQALLNAERVPLAPCK